jgi:hypothetical protein
MAARAFIDAIHPAEFGARGIESHDRAGRARRGEEHAVDDGRRRFEREFRRRAKVAGVETPRDLEATGVAGIDLDESGA